MIYGYARTSRHGLALENQLRQLKEHGVAPEAIYADRGISGASFASTRQQFTLMDSALQPGDTVVVAAFDRLSRRRADLQSIFANWCTRRIRLRSLASTEAGMTRLLDTDPDDISGAFVRDTIVSLLGFLGEIELETLKRRTVAGMERARAEGKRIGRPRTAQGTIDLARQLHAAGKSINQIAKDLRVARASVGRWVKEVQRGQ